MMSGGGGRRGRCGSLCAVQHRPPPTPSQNGAKSHTPLMTAAKRGHADCVKLLLTVGALDLRDTNGDTALHFAAGRGHMPVVAVLLDRGADHHVRNSSDDRAIDVAMQRRHTQVRRREMKVLSGCVLTNAALPPSPVADRAAHGGAHVPLLRPL